jgi:hypothetical protein
MRWYARRPEKKKAGKIRKRLLRAKKNPLHPNFRSWKNRIARVSVKR